MVNIMPIRTVKKLGKRKEDLEPADVIISG